MYYVYLLKFQVPQERVDCTLGMQYLFLCSLSGLCYNDTNTPQLLWCLYLWNRMTSACVPTMYSCEI